MVSPQQRGNGPYPIYPHRSLFESHFVWPLTWDQLGSVSVTLKWKTTPDNMPPWIILTPKPLHQSKLAIQGGGMNISFDL